MRDRIPLIVMLLIATGITAVALTNRGPSGDDDVAPPAPGQVSVEPTELAVGEEVIYDQGLSSSHRGFTYLLREVGCEAATCTAVVEATNDGSADADVETSYFLWVEGNRIRPTLFSGEGFTRPVAPEETVELRMRFPAAVDLIEVTRLEVADTVQSSGILFDL